MEIPLKLKYRRGFKSRYKSTTNNNAPSKHKGETDKNRMAFAQSQTKANQKILIITSSGKRKWALSSSMAT